MEANIKIHCVIWDIIQNVFSIMESSLSNQELEDMHFYVIERFDTIEEAEIFFEKEKI